MPLRSSPVGTANRVLVVDDDPYDQALIRSAFSRVGSDAQIDVVPEASVAIGQLSDGYRPTMAIVDLKLGAESGLEVIRWVREESAIPWLPMVVMSGSDDRTDVRSAYEAGANAYLVKPGSLEEIDDLVRRIDAFWLGACALAGDEA